MTDQRIAPVKPPYDEDVQASFDSIMGPEKAPLNIFRTVAHNPRVLARMVKGGLLDKGSISLGDRELIILRVCARCHAEYEWGVHVAIFARKSGLTREQIHDTCRSEITCALWSEKQKAVIGMVDQLHDNATIADALWTELAALYSEEQLIELVMVAGLYHAVSYVVNAFHVQFEPDSPRFSGNSLASMSDIPT